MSRYKDALMKKIETMYREPDTQENLHYNLAIADVLEVIDEFLFADVVEVVRCEKCTYGYTYPNNFSVHCQKGRTMMYANDFCSKGERINDE